MVGHTVSVPCSCVPVPVRVSGSVSGGTMDDVLGFHGAKTSRNGPSSQSFSLQTKYPTRSVGIPLPLLCLSGHQDKKARVCGSRRAADGFAGGRHRRQAVRGQRLQRRQVVA